MLAKVGTDAYGTSTIANFKENGVSTDFVHSTDETTTGVAPIWVNDQGENAIVVVPGANLLLTPADVLAADSLIRTAKVVVCELEIPVETTIAALELARKHGVLTILNTAPARKDLDPACYEVCDILCANETEAEILTGLPMTDIESGGRCVDCFLDKGCQTVIITMGSKGSIFATRADRTVSHVTVDTVSAVDTTVALDSFVGVIRFYYVIIYISGAGDAFVGALAFYLSTNPRLALAESIDEPRV
ncbi:hypothetical protein ScPMuIL_013537 [Solemya velum]